MNIADSERISAVLENIKYLKTQNINEADLIVVTMCSIRQSAVDRVHGLIDKFKKIKLKNKKLTTILTGCILKKDKSVFVEGFNYILDIKDIKRIPEILGIKNNIKNKNDYLDITPKYQNDFSANIPIMTGCNNFCSYCVVPYVREREVSRKAKDIILEIKNAVKQGYKEIWLLGQNVNSYKDPSAGSASSLQASSGQVIRFSELLKMIDEIPGDFWIRFTSSHPKDFSDDLINAMATCKKVSPYLNLPVQSGDDKVLRLMKRYYTVKDYKNKLAKLRKKIPHIAISTDIIVGFPGETKKQFLNTAKLFREVKYDMAYINKYSQRAGTPAAKLKDNVSVEEKKNREKILNAILKETALEKNKKMVSKTTTALINERRGNNYFGKDQHYKTIKISSNKNLLGQFIKVKITEAQPFTLKGIIINE